MPYSTQLQMVSNIFKKCHVQTCILDPLAPLGEQMATGLTRLVSREEKTTFCDYVGTLQNNTLYTLTDALGCRYLFLLLPHTSQKRVLLIGPYLSRPLTWQQMLETAEQAGVQPRQIKSLEAYHANIPHLPELSPLFAVIDTFAEQLWGVGNYTAVDLEKDNLGLFSPLEERAGTLSSDDKNWNMKIMELRYEYENELMQAVADGQVHKIELLLSHLQELPFERRTADPVRNIKNYCIIMNTLLRKAAEHGGVHPLHLDSVSSAFAQKIEQLPSVVAGTELMSDLFRSYCVLVRDHAVGQYSSLIRRTIAYIETDLTADLCLRTLASLQNVSPSYLSSLFSKETGKTLTEYVNEKRIRSAMQLLRSTNLQIQTIAQHCGILDVYYFSKIFKKYTGKTPREYRETARYRKGG